MKTAFIQLVIAGATDALDGFLARRFKARTMLGAYLDPLADKLLIGITYIAITLRGLLPAWFVFIVVLRDLIIMGGISFMRMRAIKVIVAPSVLSKINTTFQILLVLFVMLNNMLATNLNSFVFISIGVILTTTVLSGVQYILWGQRVYASNK